MLLCTVEAEHCSFVGVFHSCRAMGTDSVRGMTHGASTNKESCCMYTCEKRTQEHSITQLIRAMRAVSIDATLDLHPPSSSHCQLRQIQSSSVWCLPGAATCLLPPATFIALLRRPEHAVQNTFSCMTGSIALLGACACVCAVCLVEMPAAMACCCSS